ncbi:hypothetical protein Cpap_1822 [Ruminiclostridium papyrosolvens DSM 2782]|uniref:Uncharacterized protein n=1 Tax=Ruminiclostridium papyrosolvens DSM 2782 TaxID=588581 RepID=F1TDJ0_9FIRM|nr:FlxA-like family protein [Ruminiclostridium papyrosolvens]EGD47628.1 hypothetical protein Cpap_1822 [Ruminiclostridium papyrosolvens DSM 2782]WES36427.1 FlxA-like family protein [Ruminiclostridium papyrosolvens DSM 2782]
MSVSAVSTSSNITYAPMGFDNSIKLLEKQKMQLQEQIQKVNESKMDPKMKQEKVKELTEQITDIESQIRQKRMEKIKPDYGKVDSKNNNYNEDNKAQYEKSDVSINSKNMISAVTGYSDLKTMGKVRTDLKNQLRIASHSDKSPEAGQGIAKKIEKLEGDIHKKSEKINSDLRKAAKDGEKTGKQETKNDIKEDSKDKENPVSIITGDAESIQDENRGIISSNDVKSSEKVIKNGKETVPPQGRAVDIRI